ncbi:uncharacterized protein LOC128619394 [Ictalurus furcatus]|uniref:uncharacterized protein LOC128619394 n=1 Tax=Ictalurus furcatus TaxID=66913 RepID=UPI00234FCD98|nr:uncharacterized protein LOC128619394 [Ictalurus furcatus]
MEAAGDPDWAHAGQEQSHVMSAQREQIARLTEQLERLRVAEGQTVTLPAAAVFPPASPRAHGTRTSPAGDGWETGQELLTIAQGPHDVVDYALEFRTIAARGSSTWRYGWTAFAALTAPRRGIPYPPSRYLQQNPCSSAGPGSARRRGRETTQRGTVLLLWGEHPRRSPVPAEKAAINRGGQDQRTPSSPALIDSGAAENFIDEQTARTLCLPIQALSPIGGGVISHCTAPITMQASALHYETIALYVTVSTRHPIILGLPWLERHDPQISWAAKQVTRWSPYCLRHCLMGHMAPVAATTVESPLTLSPCHQSIMTPVRYSVRNEQVAYLHTGPMIAPWTSSPEPARHGVECTRSPKQNSGP